MRITFRRCHALGWCLAFLLPAFVSLSAWGQTEYVPVRNAAFISATVPAVVVTGQVFTVSLTVSNAGPMAWQSARPYPMASWELCFLFDQGIQGWKAGRGLTPVQST